MWVIDAGAHLLRGIDDRAILVPGILLVFAWLLWLRGPRLPTSFRTLSLLGALICGTIAVGTHLTLMVWWGGIFPWLHPHTAFCASSPWGDFAVFFGTVGNFCFALIGHGPGRIVALLAATMLVVRRVAMLHL